MEEEIKLEIIKGGPLKVHGSVTLIDADGNETKTKKTAFFCRCGQSANQPFCDGTHKDCGFEK
jgi:CDGSH-type Zn-finger protein